MIFETFRECAGSGLCECMCVRDGQDEFTRCLACCTPLLVPCTVCVRLTFFRCISRKRVVRVCTSTYLTIRTKPEYARALAASPGGETWMAIGSSYAP